MDGIAGKISQLLSDPDGMSKIMSVAENLFSNSSDQETKADTASDGGFSLPEGFDIGKIMGLMSALSNNQQDERSRLLLALKPHLSTPRQQKVDRAVKLLKLASLIPIVKEQGLFDLI